MIDELTKIRATLKQDERIGNQPDRINVKSEFDKINAKLDAILERLQGNRY